MDTRFSSTQKTSQHSRCSCDKTLVEWKSIEMIEDFLNKRFECLPDAISSGDASLNEDGIPESLHQVFI